MTKQYDKPERGIKSWEEADRPREKLLQSSAAQLSLAELLAILINSGTQEFTAVELARDILQAVDYDLHQLATWKPHDFRRFKGIGPARAVTLIAALELTRRREQQQVKPLTSVSSSQESYQYLKGFLADKDHEEFWIICLNQGNKLICSHLISKGGITGTVVDSRQVFRTAINTPRCVSIILAHNHPSGQLRPSQADIQLTSKLVAAGRGVDINVLDHLIIGAGGYYSFSDEGMLS